MHWEHSTITEDRIYCLYVAHDERMVVEHARRCGLPIQRISMVSALIDPSLLTFFEDDLVEVDQIELDNGKRATQ